MTCGNIAIRIQKPTPLGVIVSALEIVETCLYIVVITTVAEGVIGRKDQRFEIGIARCGVCFKVTPGIVDIRTDALAVLVVNGNDVSENVLVEEEIIVISCDIRGLTVTKAYD